MAERLPAVQRLCAHPGIGYLTGLAVVATLGPVERFSTSRKVVAYAGLEPREHSSGERQRFGRISKCGSRLLRFQLIEAATVAARHDPELKRHYWRLLQRRGQARAKVTLARRLLASP